MSWSKRRAEKVDRMVNIWTRLASGVGAARPPARRPRRGRRRALSAAAQTRKRGGGACDGAGKTWDAPPPRVSAAPRGAAIGASRALLGCVPQECQRSELPSQSIKPRILVQDWLL